MRSVNRATDSRADCPPGKDTNMSTSAKSNFGRFLILWAGEFISSIGGGLTSFGLGVYVFSKTGSAGAMSLVTFLGFLPTFILSVPAGVLADRFDRRILMMIGDGFYEIYSNVC